MSEWEEERPDASGFARVALLPNQREGGYLSLCPLACTGSKLSDAVELPSWPVTGLRALQGTAGGVSKKKYWLYLRLRIEQCSKFETNLGYLTAKKEKKNGA